ncbi:C-type lectin domain family 12 member B-like isoform X2 [Malaclemys terrapin pileata]|uniref:C-type lectin domain family 12 member B-like isoform X2 n=1 Tax=Malaclemys terrapin pileata TaxID=2991368 RepID=UPI0023A87C63|nr:C-type lectin domain family 12 member B-like isoform X2 [Malaclemys terrapin pileata]
MTEEITYADLEFNKSYALENIPKPPTPEEKGLPTSSPWCLAALTLLTLCLALMVGLLALGVVFFQVTSICQEENVKLKEKEKALQTNFSSRLQEIRESLCFKGEVKNKNNGMSCTLCPTNWQQMGGDTCYYISSGKKTWEGSRTFCASQHSTLLMIKDKEKLENVSRYLIKENYWIGLSRRNTERPDWFWEDTTALSTSEKGISVYSVKNPCAYLWDKYIYADRRCDENNFWICEKAPFQLRLTDNQ